MKTTKQPQHCAHVAAYYADRCDTLKSGTFLFDLKKRNIPLTEMPDYSIGGAKWAIGMLVQALSTGKVAAREWVRAGGAA